MQQKFVSNYYMRHSDLSDKVVKEDFVFHKLVGLIRETWTFWQVMMKILNMVIAKIEL